MANEQSAPALVHGDPCSAPTLAGGAGCPTPTLAGGADLSAFVLPLCRWYRENARPLPWREEQTPYHVWLSEVMLQQTRIEAVRPYYARFLAAAPDVAALAALPDDRLMKLWEGLGYYSRARNLKRAARILMDQYGGRFPRDYAALRALPGVGDYTAGAIASIVFDLPTPAVDGNVLRVIARLTADAADVTQPDTKKRITAALRAVYEDLPGSHFTPHAPAQTEENRQKTARGAEEKATTDAHVVTPATLTQGLMELGEVVCIPGTPHCEACPLSGLCRARAEGLTDRIPHRAPKAARRIEHRLVLVLHDGAGRYALRRRPGAGLLAGLWELPNLLLEGPAGSDGLEERALAFCRENGLVPTEMAAIEDARHLFTHIEWRMQGLYINVLSDGRAANGLKFVGAEALDSDYALPSAFRAFRRYIASLPGSEG